MSADTDGLIAQARANRDLFDQSLMLALAAALEAAEAQLAEQGTIATDALADAEEQRDTLAAENERLREVAEIAAANFEESARQFYAERARAEAAEAQLADLRVEANIFKDAARFHSRERQDAEAQRDTLAEAAEWYVQCLEDVQAGIPVRGLAEAEAGYRAALAGVAPPEEET